MNANELSDDLEGAKLVILRLNDMLRQQQAEIEALKLRELTDEEILELCPPNHSDMMNEAYTIDFARAILRKASEK